MLPTYIFKAISNPVCDPFGLELLSSLKGGENLCSVPVAASESETPNLILSVAAPLQGVTPSGSLRSTGSQFRRLTLMENPIAFRSPLAP
jgi:hypothetical protein